MIDFEPIKGSKIGELAAHFEIVLGRTPSDAPGKKPSPRPRERGRKSVSPFARRKTTFRQVIFTTFLIPRSTPPVASGGQGRPPHWWRFGSYSI